MSDRAAMQQAQLDVITVTLMREGINKHRARELADHFVNFTSCIGKDPRCPCQDGDACHYKDCGGTKAWPVPKAEPVGEVVEVNNDGFKCEFSQLLAIGTKLYTTPPAVERPWVALTEQDMPSGEDPMFDHKYFIAGMVYAAKVLQEKNNAAPAAQPEQQAEPVACRFCHSKKGCWTWQCYHCGEIDDVQQPAPLPVQPEPLEYWNAVEGWVKIDEVREHFDAVGCGTIYKTTGEDRVPLYTAPPQREWVGLTVTTILNMMPSTIPADYDGELMEFARAVEAKLKEKNHG